MRYLATINTPGYLPMDDDPPVFDTAQEAWAYLAEERKVAEDSAEFEPDDPAQYEYSDFYAMLEFVASDDHDHGSPLADPRTNPDGSGCFIGDNPGYDGDHDLGLAYSVSLTADSDCRCTGDDQCPEHLTDDNGDTRDQQHHDHSDHVSA